jgi:hypothetical protein
MGYIQQSDTKKIYAYLTQLGKEKIISGDTTDFQVQYFSLHDEDINYIIASKISGTTYNIPKSGFIPDITGDDNICLPNISDATFLEKNMLVGIVQPPIPQPPNPTVITATIVGTCSTDGESFQISVTNANGGTGQGYYWYVKTDVITFPSATATLIESTILSTSISDDYQVGTPKSFNATFKFTDTYLPREADSYNYTVYVGDSSGTEVELQKFTDINCSKRKYGWVAYIQDVNADYVPLTLITDDNLFSGDIPGMPEQKYGFAAFVIDNGNRRKDLNINDSDLALFYFNNYSLIQKTFIQDGCQFNTRAATENVLINFNATRTIESTNIGAGNGQSSEGVRLNGVIIRSQTDGLNAWKDSTQNSLVPSSIYGNASYVWYTGNFDALHPTVKPFSDMGLNGFQIQYVEVAPKYDVLYPGVNPIGSYFFRRTSAVYTIGYDGTLSPEFKFFPTQIGSTPVAFGNTSQFDVSWNVFTNKPC